MNRDDYKTLKDALCRRDIAFDEDRQIEKLQKELDDIKSKHSIEEKAVFPPFFSKYEGKWIAESEENIPFEEKAGIVISQLRADRDRLQEAIKALGEDMRICQKSITDEKVLIGFNMAVAICNKHLAESEDK